ncbi:MAG: isoprenylcysteine carboxylmethyltransferase family protein [Sulfurimonas sp.]
MKSKILVGIQFLMIFLMLLPLGTPMVYFKLGAFFIVLGLAVGVAALYKNKLGNFNIVPDIKEDCTLVKSGIYGYIRHPMYTSVLVTMFGVLLLYWNVYYMIYVYAILLVNLLVKMFYEESLWKCHSDEYVQYTKSTSRLIPKIF